MSPQIPLVSVYVYSVYPQGDFAFLSECVHISVNLSLDSLTSCMAVYSQLTPKSVILMCWKECRITVTNPQFSDGCCCLFCGCLCDDGGNSYGE